MKTFLLNLFISFLSLTAFSQVMPVVEVRIGGTERSKDDYVGANYISCTARLVNGASFTGDIQASLRNLRFGTGGQVVFSSTGGTSAGSSTLSILLRRDNSFTTFFIKARTNSTRDKDAAIEVIDARSGQNPIVLARKAFMVIPANPLPSTRPRVDVAINSVSTLDDYVTWAPTACTIRLNNASSFTSPVSVTLRTMPGSIGRLNFASSSLARGNTATATSLTLSLPTSGTAVRFFVAGRFGNPSLRDKDAIIEITIAGTDSVISREPLMVRVRRNANNLTAEERQRFLNAVVTFNNTFNGYMTYNDVHSAAGKPEGHSGPVFLPWHRAFILDMERELQRVDPSVTLPYWKFDAPAPNLFSLDFLGSRPTATGDSFADFNSTNPLAAWTAPGGPGVRRKTKFENAANPYTGNSTFRTEEAVLANGTEFSVYATMEGNPHSNLHGQAGGTSGDWMGSIPTAVKDPLFFFLHSNIDRMWAKWQWINNRFDASSSLSYSPQGSFPNSGTIHVGHYALDTMWPWNGITGTYDGVGTAPINQRPTTAPGGGLAEAVSYTNAPGQQPQPRNLIDYRININTTAMNNGLGFGYDDVPFK